MAYSLIVFKCNKNRCCLGVIKPNEKKKKKKKMFSFYCWHISVAHAKSVFRSATLLAPCDIVLRSGDGIFVGETIPK